MTEAEVTRAVEAMGLLPSAPEPKQPAPTWLDTLGAFLVIAAVFAVAVFCPDLGGK